MARARATGAHDPVLILLERTLPLDAVLPFAAGLVVILGGLAFVSIGPLIIWSIARKGGPNPVGATAFALGTIAMGCLFVHIGWRVLRASGRQVVIGPRARYAVGLLVAVAAVGTMLRAWTEDSVAIAAQAIGMGFFAFLFYRSGRHITHLGTQSRRIAALVDPRESSSRKSR